MSLRNTELPKELNCTPLEDKNIPTKYWHVINKNSSTLTLLRGFPNATMSLENLCDGMAG